MVLYAKFAHGSQFLGEKKQFVNPLHGLQVITIIVMKENSGVFFETPCRIRPLSRPRRPFWGPWRPFWIFQVVPCFS